TACKLYKPSSHPIARTLHPDGAPLGDRKHQVGLHFLHTHLVTFLSHLNPRHIACSGRGPSTTINSSLSAQGDPVLRQIAYFTRFREMTHGILPAMSHQRECATRSIRLPGASDLSRLRCLRCAWERS